MGKSKEKPDKPKSEDTNQEKLYLLHMDLCGLIRVASVNGKKYILVIVDDYSWFTWVKCLRSKDEAPKFIIKFLKMIQVRLKTPIRRIRTDNGTKFVNQTLHEYYEKVGISHETFVARSPQQNGFIESRNRTLIEAARTIFDPLAPKVIAPIPEVVALEHTASTGLPSSTILDQDAPSSSNSQTAPKTQSPVISNDVEEENHDLDVAHMNNNPFFGIPILENDYESSSLDVIPTIVHTAAPNSEHTTFLNGILREEVYVSQPDGFVDKDNLNHVYKLKKALYGLKQAPHAWYDMLSKFLLSHEFYNGTVDPTLFIKRQGKDILLSSYAIESLKKYGMESSDPVDTPWWRNLNWMKIQKGKAIDPTHYRGMLGTLMYLIASRPDLTFVITANVPEIYMQEFWATVSLHHNLLRFKMNDKSHTLNVENFRDMLHICPRLPGQRYEDPPFEEEILSFIRDLGHTGEIRVISRHQDTQIDSVILPDVLTNQVMLDSKAYKEYYAVASEAIPPKAKTKYKKKTDELVTSPKSKITSTSKGTKFMSKSKVTKPDVKKQPTKKTKAKGDGVDTQSKVPDEQEQKTFGIDEGTGTIPRVPDVPPYESKSDKESWGDSEDEDDNDDDSDNDDGDNDDDDENDDHDDDSDDERTKSDSDEIPDTKLTNVDQSENEEENVDEGVRTSSDDELADAEKLDEEEIMDDEENDEVLKELYEDVNVNLEKDDAEMTDANPGVNNEIASLMVTSAPHVTLISKITYGFTTTSPPLPLFFNPILQQLTPTITTPTFTIITSTNPTVTLPEIPKFASVFMFDQRVSTLESKMSELKQTNQFAKTVSLIPDIVHKYLASKMKEAVNVAVQLQTNKLKEEAYAENQEFINQVDSTKKKIIKDQVKAQVSKMMPKIDKYVNETLGDEVLVRSTNQPQTAYTIAASLSEFELKKIVINEIETNKSINKSDTQKNLYNALVESYNSDKDIIISYGDVVLLKRGRDDQDKDEDPSAGSERGTNRRKSGKDAESSKYSRSKEKKSSSTSKDASQSQHKSSNKYVYAEEPCHTVEELGMQKDQEFVTGDNDEQPIDKEVTKADWFKKPERPLTPDPDCSKRCQIDFSPAQTCITQAALAEEPPTSFDEFNDTSFDFFAFVLNRLKIPNLAQEILVGLAFNLLKGTCKSIIELEYHFGECPKATTERLDWHNLDKNYLRYLKGGDSSRRYLTSVTKTKAATYELKCIEDLVPELWSPMVVNNDQHAYFGTSHWGPKHKTFYEYASNLTSSKDVYSRRRNIVVTRLTIMKKYDYGHIEEIEVRQDDHQLYTFKEDPHGIIYVDQFKRNRLMRTNKLHKFSDGTLNDVRTALHDIAAGIRMKYLPMRKLSNLDKKRAWVMVQDIDKQLYQRRLMKNLEKFVGGRPYGKDLRLLDRII
nr:Gag-Pol polyprotein [Tanacetum cinerariifolium]